MYYIQELYDFLRKLDQNNNREWFAAHRDTYERLRNLWLADIDRLIAAMAKWEPRLASLTAKDAAYRIHRDTRFSLDKTPYKTYFSAAISPWGRKTNRAGYYIEIGFPKSYDQGLYGGLWCLESPMLKKMRHAIVDNIEEWQEIVTNPDMEREFPGWCSSSIKTIPKGWDRNHPQAEYLRMTNYGKYHPCTADFYLTPDWPERAAEIFSHLRPLIDFLNYSIDE